MNTGIILEERQPGDALYGGVFAPPLVRQIVDWTAYLATFESQRSNLSDFMDCTTLSAVQAIETQMNADIALGKYHPEALQYFQDAGYMENGKIHLSARYNAVMNKTTPQGQYMSVAGNGLKVDGLLPYKDMPMDPNMTWAEYYTQPTDEQIAKAKQIYQYLEVGWNWVNIPDIQEAALNSPVQIATSMCPGWSTDDPIATCGGPMEHCTIYYRNGNKDNYTILDHYPPYLKELSPSYHIFCAAQYVVRPALPPTLWSKLLDLIKTKKI